MLLWIKALPQNHELTTYCLLYFSFSFSTFVFIALTAFTDQHPPVHDGCWLYCITPYHFLPFLVH